MKKSIFYERGAGTWNLEWDALEASSETAAPWYLEWDGGGFRFALQICVSDLQSATRPPRIRGGLVAFRRGFTGASQGLNRPLNGFPGRLTRDSHNRRLTQDFTWDTFRTSPKIYMNFSEIFFGFSRTFPGFFLGLQKSFCLRFFLRWKIDFFTNCFTMKKSIFYDKKDWKLGNLEWDALVISSETTIPGGREWSLLGCCQIHGMRSLLSRLTRRWICLELGWRYIE